MLVPGWKSVLNEPRSRKVILVTLTTTTPDYARRAFSAVQSKPTHLALAPGAFTFSTADNAHVTDTATGRTRHFAPWLQQWPMVEHRLSPQDRRVEIPTTDVTILPDAGVASQVIDAGGGQVAYGRIDMWSDGVALENVYPLAEGPVRTPAKNERRAGPITLSISDGDPLRNVQFPPQAITHEDFPGAPMEVVDSYVPQWVQGAMPERIFCIPIDQGGRVYMVCAGAMSQFPTRVQKGGSELPRGSYRFAIGYAAVSGYAFTALILNKPVKQYGYGLSEDITVSGGYGIASPDALTSLLRDSAGYEISPSGKMHLRELLRQFDLSVLINKSGDSWELAKNIVAQTSYALTFRRNQVDLVDLLSQAPRTYLGLGTGLLQRMTEQGSETSLDSVRNAFEIKISRDVYGSTALDNTPLYRVYRDRQSRWGQPEAVRRLCEESEKKYGRRFWEVDAADLAAIVDQNGNVLGSPSGERFGDALVQLHAFTRKPHTYLADWYEGMQLSLNQLVFLTDANEALSNQQTRLTRIQYGPTGPVCTFSTDRTILV